MKKKRPYDYAGRYKQIAPLVTFKIDKRKGNESLSRVEKGLIRKAAKQLNRKEYLFVPYKGPVKDLPKVRKAYGQKGALVKGVYVDVRLETGARAEFKGKGQIIVKKGRKVTDRFFGAFDTGPDKLDPQDPAGSLVKIAKRKIKTLKADPVMSEINVGIYGTGRAMEGQGVEKFEEVVKERMADERYKRFIMDGFNGIRIRALEKKRRTREEIENDRMADAVMRGEVYKPLKPRKKPRRASRGNKKKNRRLR